MPIGRMGGFDRFGSVLVSQPLLLVYTPSVLERRLALKLHPDRGGDSKAFQEICHSVSPRVHQCHSKSCREKVTEMTFSGTKELFGNTGIISMQLCHRKHFCWKSEIVDMSSTAVNMHDIYGSNETLPFFAETLLA